MEQKFKIEMKKADEAMEKAKLDSEKDTDIRSKEHEAKMTDIKSGHEKIMAEIQGKHDLEKMIKEKESKQMDQNFQLEMKKLEMQEKLMMSQMQMGMCNPMNQMMANSMMMPMMQNQCFQGFQCMNNQKEQNMSPAPSNNSQEQTKEPNSNNKPEEMPQTSGNFVMSMNTPMMQGNCGMNMMQNNYGNPMMMGNFGTPMMMGNFGMPMMMGNCGMNMMQGNLGMSRMNGQVVKM